MNMMLVDMSELVTSDYDLFLDVTYHGQPFTGKAYEKTENIYTEYSYLNGLGHGQCFSIYANGNKMEQFELFEGEEVGESYLWFDNGQMREYNNERFTRNWNKDGMLIRDYRFADDIKLEYFSSGELMKSSISNKIEYLTKSGKVFALYENGETSFDGTVLDEYLDQICDEDFFLSILQEYVSFLLQKDKCFVISMLKRMLNHQNLHIQYIAINSIGWQQVVALKDDLRDKLDDRRIPSTQYDRYSNAPYCSYSFSLGDVALASLKKL